MNDKDEAELAMFSAVLFQRELAESSAGTANTVTVARVVNYARQYDHLRDLHLERKLRENAAIRELYMGFVTAHSRAFSPMAAAASSGSVDRRVVGPFVVEYMKEGGYGYLIVRCEVLSDVPSQIEVRDPDGLGCRVALGAPIDGVIQLRLDPGNPDLKVLEELFVQVETRVFLL